MPKSSAQQGSAPAHGGPPPAGETRRRLLDAAATAIATRGWGDVTTRQVAAGAGVNPALVHYHFGSMARLRREAALDVLAHEVGGPTLALLDPADLRDGIVECMRAIGAIDPRSRNAAVLYEAMLAASRDDELRVLLAGALDSFRTALADRIRREGGADPEASAAAVAAALDGALLHRRVDADVDLGRLAAPLIAALLLPGSGCAS